MNLARFQRSVVPRPRQAAGHPDFLPPRLASGIAPAIRREWTCAGRTFKNQHYVHRAYLEGFQDPALERNGEGYVWVYMPGKSPFRQRPERVARRNYYYCYRREEQRQFHAEHTLQKLEDIALPILRQLRERRFTLNPQDRLTFAGYIALSHTRVPTFERSVDRIASLLVAKQLEFVADDKRALGEAVAEMREQTGRERRLTRRNLVRNSQAAPLWQSRRAKKGGRYGKCSE